MSQSMSNHESKPNISSFVIRFVREPKEDSSSGRDRPRPYRGAIRHVQTDEELGFTQWQDAVHFIQQFIPIHDLEQKEQ